MRCEFDYLVFFGFVFLWHIVVWQFGLQCTAWWYKPEFLLLLAFRVELLLFRVVFSTFGVFAFG